MDTYKKNKLCKNCDYPLDNCNKFCTNCGQKDLNKKLMESTNKAQLYQSLNQTFTEKLNTLSEQLEEEKSQNQILARQLLEFQKCCEDVCSN
jgi:hypothetical protein